MGHRRGGGRLGGERGDDSGRDLRLQCCGGLGVSHPKRNKKNCGLELAQAAGAAENEEPKEYLICRRNSELWLEWNSTTTQQAAGEK
jgi:hypothetical protein